MIIKGLFKRYQRWNPVHPTTGAFWGMGIGIGCGVGWGPGFGPDVVGYVGAGCGVGFSVGITFVGIGIGLPANTHVKAPYNAFVATRSTVLEFVRSNGLISMKNVTEDWWKYILQKSALQQGPSGSIACFENKHSLVERFNLSEMRSQMSCNTRSMLERLGAFKDGCFKPNKGST